MKLWNERDQNKDTDITKIINKRNVQIITIKDVKEQEDKKG